MGFKDLNFGEKSVFDSAKDNILEDFYIPALSTAVMYKRVAGFFSSTSLALAARGIFDLINNGGHIHLITSVNLTSADEDVIKKTILNLEEGIISEIEESQDELKVNHLKMLGWLIKNRHLEIKIAVPNNKRGIEHQKYGILQDSEENIIEFFGSDNESANGWLFHHEKFHIYVSWIESDFQRHLRHDLIDFEELWQNNTENMKIYPISEAFKKNIIKHAPKDEEEFINLANNCLDSLRQEYSQIYRKSRQQPEEIHPQRKIIPKLRDYQLAAINSWVNNGFRGILKMATGTGKTFTAVQAINNYLKDNKNNLVVIVAPTQLLVSQWINTLKEESITNIVPIMINKNIWIDELKKGLLKMDLGRETYLFAVATYDSFINQNFMNIIKGFSGNKLIVCDEVHHAWAPETRKGLVKEYDARLGLSATPEIYMDIEGTKELLDFFGGICYTFDMKEAIPEFLTEYEYYAEIVILNDEECWKYEELSSKIARMIKINEGKIDQKTFMLILERSKILTNADAKWSAFEKILDSIQNMKRTLIYCSDKQINRVKKILKNRKIFAHQITHEESLNYRNEIIKLFQEDKYRVIIAMKVLDEGIDIPSIERAIILASSGNPIEYVQRRGRILRKSEGKEFSIIHDILVFPWKQIPLNIGTAELSALRKEIKRVNEFTQLSRNPLTVKNIMAPYESIMIGTNDEEV